MTRTLCAYLTRVFLEHLAVIGFGFVALLQVFDLLKNARDVMERHGESVASIATYAALRLPGTISFLLPLCILMSALMTMSRMAQHNEIIALKAAGLSMYRFVLGFAPVIVVVAVVHGVLSDQLAPAANRALERWDAQSVADTGKTAKDGGGLWLRRGKSIVRVSGVLNEGRLLAGVTEFLRDERGNLTEKRSARQARYSDGTWLLIDVDRTVWPMAERPLKDQAARLAWPIDLAPRDLVNLTIRPEGMSLKALLDVAQSTGLGRHPEYFYRTWIQKRIATPISALVMLLLAASVAQTLARGHGGAINFAAGAGLGFLYLITDGVVFTLGEGGALPPTLAAWAPLAVFGCVGGWLLIAREGA